MFLQKFNKTLAVVLALNSLSPIIALAGVSINEVAWMGNSQSQYGEWIELYNYGTEAVSLKDAVLYESGGATQIIKLTKSIDAGGYYLIARSTPSLPDPVSGLADDLGSFGGSGLSNSGESLVLKSASGEVLDSLDAASGWSAGNSSTKETMQRSGNVWITATGTPRSVNAVTSSLAAVSGDNVSDTVNNLGGNIENDFTNLSSHSSPADLSQKVEEVRVFASAGRSRLALVDTPVKFEERLFNSKYEILDGGNVTWNFGDGQTATGNIATHSYKFPGDYIVIMNVLRGGEEYVARCGVRVVPAELEITEVTPDFVTIRNSSGYEANMGGWQIVSPRAGFLIPEDTIILSKHEIVFAKEMSGLGNDISEVKLLSPNRRVISVFRPKTKAPVLISAVSTSTQLLEAEKRLSAAKNSLALLVASQPVKKVAISSAKPIATVAIFPQGSPSSTPLRVTQVVIPKSRSIFKTMLDFIF